MSYYGFETSYVVGIKSWEKAPDFMFSSVYAYRVIPNYLSVHVTEAITSIVNNDLPFAKSFLLKQGSLFYHSTFLINVFFFLLTSFVLHKILELKPVEILSNGKSEEWFILLRYFLSLFFSMFRPIATVSRSFSMFLGCF
jgi:hypothetical protein